MKWCPHCRKYVQTRVEKTEIRAVKWTRLVYHCSECNGFIDTSTSLSINGERSRTIESRQLNSVRNTKPIGKQSKISNGVNKRPQKTKNLRKERQQ